METIITPADLQAAHLTGMWQGGLGVALIIFGVIGYPATRYFFGVMARPFTKKPPRVPVGSPFWDKYMAKDWRPELLEQAERRK